MAGNKPKKQVLKAPSSLSRQTNRHNQELIAVQGQHVSHIRPSPRQPAVSVEDLGLMMEIDMALGRKKDFYDRLQRALDTVWVACGERIYGLSELDEALMPEKRHRRLH